MGLPAFRIYDGASEVHRMVIARQAAETYFTNTVMSAGPTAHLIPAGRRTVRAACARARATRAQARSARISMGQAVGRRRPAKEDRRASRGMG